MTTAEMIAEVQASLGNRTDLATIAGQTRIVMWLNWAQHELAGFHRERVIPPRRFHFLEGVHTFHTYYEEVRITAQLALSFVHINAGSADNDYYNDWIVQTIDYDTVGADHSATPGILNQKRVIVDYIGTPSFNATVWPDWDVAPDPYTTIGLYKKSYGFYDFVGLDPNVTMWSVQRLERVDDSRQLEHKTWDSVIGTSFVNLGEPAEFARRGNSLMFNITPDDWYYYRLFYYKFPTLLSISDLTASPDFPIYWHEVIVQGAIYRGFSKLMEPDRAAGAKESFVMSAGNMYDEYQIEASHQIRGMKVRMK